MHSKMLADVHSIIQMKKLLLKKADVEKFCENPLQINVPTNCGIANAARTKERLTLLSWLFKLTTSTCAAG